MSRTKYLPLHWQEWVSGHPDLSRGYATPEFNNEVYIFWEDGSTMHFQYAFFVEDVEKGEICVLTEHCGYHCFSTMGMSRYKMVTCKKHEKING